MSLFKDFKEDIKEIVSFEKNYSISFALDEPNKKITIYLPKKEDEDIAITQIIRQNIHNLCKNKYRFYYLSNSSNLHKIVFSLDEKVFNKENPLTTKKEISSPETPIQKEKNLTVTYKKFDNILTKDKIKGCIVKYSSNKEIYIMLDNNELLQIKKEDILEKIE